VTHLTVEARKLQVKSGVAYFLVISHTVM